MLAIRHGLVARLRARRRPDWVRHLPPEQARALSRNLRLILDPRSLLDEETPRPDLAR